ncbi:MAG: hypothetical protein ACYC0K_08390, partial [Thermoleophilia bacterium]
MSLPVNYAIVRQALGPLKALAALQHFRFGGEEFVVMAPHTGASGARVLASCSWLLAPGHRHQEPAKPVPAIV